MRNTRLEKAAREHGYEVANAPVVNGSLVDYCFEKNGQRLLLLIRENFDEKDALYLSSVGKTWDKKVLLTTQRDIPDAYYKIADQLAVHIATNLDSVPFSSEVPGLSQAAVSPTLLNDISRLAWPARLLLVLTACWRETLGILICGALAMFTAQEYVFPLILEIIKRAVAS